MSEAEALDDLAERVGEALGLAGFTHTIHGGELVLRPARVEDLPALLRFLRDDAECGFGVLMDITAADFPARPQRFEVVYNLLSLSNNARARIHAPVGEGEAVPTALPLWPSAGWYEREVWDMFGVPFVGHPDLRRILCDYGFEGHPLRKDFPLTGHVEVRYDPLAGRVAYGPVNLVQDYRDFDALSPWEGITGVQVRLPGDERAQKA